MLGLTGMARLLAATAIGAVMTVPALAQDYGAENGDAAPFELENPEGETIEGDKSGVYSYGSQLILDNQGTIRGNGTYDGFDALPDAGVVFTGGPADITNSGVISGERFGITTAYYYNADTNSIEGRAIGSSIDNSGSIIGDTDDGVRLIGGGTVVNSGLISGGIGGGFAFADGISMFAYENQDVSGLTSIGTVTNLAGGVIEGNRFGIILSNGGTIDNAGTIGGGLGSVLIQAIEPGKIGTVTNSGAMNGTLAFANLASASVDNDGTITSATGAGIETNNPMTLNNDGTITGATSGIYSDGTSLTIDNSGTIRGNGTYDGFAAAPDAGITFAGGPADITNSGTISGERFGITTAYFVTEANQFEGRAIGSTIDNSGSIIGDTDDGVRLLGGGTIVNSGLISGGIGGSFAFADGVSMFAFQGQDLGSFTSIGTVNNLSGGVIEGFRFGIILSNGGTIDNAGTVSGGTGGILVQATDGGKIGTVTNSGTVNGYVNFNAVDQGTLTNSGTITATNATGVTAYAPLSVTNEATGSITGSINGIHSFGATTVIDNAGTIRGNGTSVIGFEPNAGVAITSGTATITNSGTISGAGAGIVTTRYQIPATGVYDDFVEFVGVSNSGSIIGDTNDGIRITTNAAVTNGGLISGRGSAGADGISIFHFDVADGVGETMIGSVVNQAGGTIDGVRAGIILSGGGSITNDGTISGGFRGVIVQAQQTEPGKIGQVTNSGTIAGGISFIGLSEASVANSGAIASTTGFGIETGDPTTIVNGAGGTITGATSGIYAYGSSLSVDNSGTIRGNGTYDGFDAPPDAGITFAGGPADIVNSGIISGAGAGITSAYFYNAGTNALEGRAIGSNVDNSGTITGESNDGVRLIGGGDVNNSGSISGLGGSLADGVSMYAYDDQDVSGLTSIGTVTNLAGGDIYGNRFGIILSNGGTIDNAGTIGGGLGAILIQAINPGKIGTVTNSGTINGTLALANLASASVGNSGNIGSATGAGIDTNSPLTLTNDGAITGLTSGVYSDGSSLTVDNEGTIRGNGTYDGFAAAPDAGITFAGGPADITNSGTISGAGAGITTAYFYNAATNTLEGRAIGSSVDNSGTISGESNDGVRLIGGGDVTNSGGISGLGGPLADGVSIFAFQGQDTSTETSIGTVTNLAGGSITGERMGIILSGGGVVTNAGTITGNDAGVFIQAQETEPGKTGTVFNQGVINGGVGFVGLASASLNNSGTISVGSGPAIGSGSALALTNSGTIAANGPVAIDLSDFDDTVTLLTGSSINGAIDGDGGSDSVVLSGSGATASALQSVGEFLDFESLTVSGGYWTAAGNTGTFGSAIINGGTLAVNATLVAPVTVNAGATLAGTGLITGNVTVNSGGTFSPGNSIGTINVAGSVTFGSGSTYLVETTPSGLSDLLDVTGDVIIASGVSMQVLAGSGTYADKTTYVVISTDGKIDGKFSTVSTDLAFLTPKLSHKSTSVELTLSRNKKSFASVSAPNTVSAANAVAALGENSSIYNAVLAQSVGGARQAFASLSGGAYGDLEALLVEDVGALQLSPAADGLALSWNAARTPHMAGFHSASSLTRGKFSFMMAGGQRSGNLASGEASAAVQSRFVAGALGYKSGRLQAAAGVAAGWHEVSASRAIRFPGFAEQAQARFELESRQLQGEVSYSASRGPLAIAPYLSASSVTIDTPAFREIGSASALAFDASSRSFGKIALGARLSGSTELAGIRISPRVDFAIRKAWGDVDGNRLARFRGGEQDFDSISAGLNREAATLDAGLDFRLGPVAFSTTYQGEVGTTGQDHSALIGASLKF